MLFAPHASDFALDNLESALLCTAMGDYAAEACTTSSRPTSSPPTPKAHPAMSAGDPNPGTGTTPESVLRELRAAAAVKRAARRRVADAAAARSPDVSEHWSAHHIAATRWTSLIHAAGAAGHPIADIARAAGVAASSVHYRLHH